MEPSPKKLESRDVQDVLDIIARARSHGATPEAIAAYDASIAEARNRAANEARERRLRALVDSGIPLIDEHMAALVDGKLEHTLALRITTAWLAGPRAVLVLVGDKGTGKTTAGAHAAMTRLSDGPVVYVKEPTLARWSMFARYDRQWAQAVACATLIIDEIGTAKARDLDDAREGVSRIIDDRIGQSRRTVVIGNVSEADLTRRWDGRLLDRLRQIGFIAEVRGESLRGAA